jgi:hypothetical protein
MPIRNGTVDGWSTGQNGPPLMTNPRLLQFRSINQAVVMTENNYLTQTQLAERWQVTEITLERWRSEGIGPIYMKMMGRVRYRLSDITDFEEDSLRGSTSQRASARSDR